MKKISFVILSWNSEKYLKDCLNSVLNITNFDKEIFIVDNGSTDNSIKIINSFIDKRVNLISLEKNYGTTKSRNLALKEIKNTDYICILDSDTIINDNAISVLCEYLDKNKDVGLVGPSMINEKNEKQIPYRKFPTWKIKFLKALPIKKYNQIGESLEKYDEKIVSNEFECDYLISACWMMKLNIYTEIGGLDEKIFYAPEDVEYCMRLRMNGYKIVHLKKSLIVHYYQRISKQKMISKINLTHLYGLIYVLKKYKKFLKKYNRNY